MALEDLSKKLKGLISIYDTGWFLGELAHLMNAAGSNIANDQLGKLSSPQRQLYYLAELLMSSDPVNGIEISYDPDKWNAIVDPLNQIEQAYALMFSQKMMRCG